MHVDKLMWFLTTFKEIRLYSIVMNFFTFQYYIIVILRNNLFSWKEQNYSSLIQIFEVGNNSIY